MNVLVETNSRFAVELFKNQMEERPARNIFSSPISISAGIAMLLFGSRRNTADQIKRRYVQCIKELYNSELESVDFMNATEEVRQKINSWVERQTNGDITNFFPVNSVDQSTGLVLLNAVSFQGKWKIPFNPKDTHRGVFWTSKL
ncbi:hypothetical protein E2320_011046, partial [Naja naja]